MVFLRKSKWFPVAPSRLAITEPFLDDLIASQFVLPRALWHVSQKDTLIQRKIARRAGATSLGIRLNHEQAARAHSWLRNTALQRRIMMIHSGASAVTVTRARHMAVRECAG